MLTEVRALPRRCGSAGSGSLSARALSAVAQPSAGASELSRRLAVFPLAAEGRAAGRLAQGSPGPSYQPPSCPGRAGRERGALAPRRSPVSRARSVRRLGPVRVPTRSAAGRAALPGEGPWGRAPAAGLCLEERSAPGEGEPASALGRAGEVPPPGPRSGFSSSGLLLRGGFVKAPYLFSWRA